MSILDPTISIVIPVHNEAEVLPEFLDKKFLPEIEKIKNYKIEVVFVDDSDSSDKLLNKTFVITGSLNNFSNRDELIALIENNGGHVVSSVTKNVDYLINNDVTSTSSKNKKAKELNIPIVDENTFLGMIK